MKKLILLCGESCSGKSTLEKQLEERGMNRIISYTTRPPREGEKHGVDYYFVDKREFMQTEMMEMTSYQVKEGDKDEVWFYGTAKDSVKEGINVLVVNPKGIEQIVKYVKEENLDIEIKVVKVERELRLRLLSSLERRPMTDNDKVQIINRFEQDEKDFSIGFIEYLKTMGNNFKFYWTLFDDLGYLEEWIYD